MTRNSTNLTALATQVAEIKAAQEILSADVQGLTCALTSLVTVVTAQLGAEDKATVTTTEAPAPEAPVTYPKPVFSSQQQEKGEDGRWRNVGPRKFYDADHNRVTKDGAPWRKGTAEKAAPEAAAPKAPAKEAAPKRMGKEEFKALKVKGVVPWGMTQKAAREAGLI